MKVGERIKIIRESKQVTAEEMAEVLQMSLGNYHKIERNEIDLNTEKINKIAEKLGLEPYRLLQDEGICLYINTNNGSGGNGYQVYNDHGNTHILKIQEERIKELQDQIKTQSELIALLRDQLSNVPAKS